MPQVTENKSRQILSQDEPPVTPQVIEVLLEHVSR